MATSVTSLSTSQVLGDSHQGEVAPQAPVPSQEARAALESQVEQSFGATSESEHSDSSNNDKNDKGSSSDDSLPDNHATDSENESEASTLALQHIEPIVVRPKVKTKEIAAFPLEGRIVVQSILKSKAVENYKRPMDIEVYFRKIGLQCDMNGLVDSLYECRKFVVASTLGDEALRVLELFGLMNHSYEEIKRMLIKEYRAVDAIDRAFLDFGSFKQEISVRVPKYRRDLEERADRVNTLVTEAKGLTKCTPITGDYLTLKF